MYTQQAEEEVPRPGHVIYPYSRTIATLALGSQQMGRDGFSTNGRGSPHDNVPYISELIYILCKLSSAYYCKSKPSSSLRPKGSFS